MTAEADVLRWMSQAYDEDRPKKDRKKKWKMVINYWLTQLQKGEWIRSSISTTVERKFERHTDGIGSTKKKRVIVKAKVTEMVSQYDGYRPRLEGEKDTRKAFYWRGARVWRK